MIRTVRQAAWILAALVLAAPAVFAALKINEVYYNAIGSLEANQYVELYNPGPGTEYLDGLVLTDEGSEGIEGVFRFPGSGTDYPVAPGEYVLIAADADNSDGLPPHLAAADWECYAGGIDYDNPSVPNLTLVSGVVDFYLYPVGDNVVLATGADLSAPMDPSTVIDGMNIASGAGEVVPLSSSASDANPNTVSVLGEALARCPDGADTDFSSYADFWSHAISPGTSNGCGVTVISIGDRAVVEGQSGSVSATFPVTLSAPGLKPLSVTYATSDGSAIAGSDYTAVPTTVLSFALGVVSQNVTVTVLSDTNPEPDEVFYVNLSDPTNVILGDIQGVGTIRADEHQITRIARSSSNIVTTWSAASGGIYRMDFSTNLFTPAWSALAGDVTATGSTASKADPMGPARPKLYRLWRVY